MRTKILELKHGLKLIAIWQLWQDSVKEYLYQILKTKYRVLRTLAITHFLVSPKWWNGNWMPITIIL